MILEKTQIKELITTPQNTNLSTYREQHNLLNTYFNGGDIASEIEKITGFENETQRNLRQKVARSPKDLIQRLVNQFEKAFNATGGSENFDLKVKNQKEEFINLVSMLPEGLSLNKWMHDYWFESYVTDPNGVVFIEAEAGDDPKAYPTYKSVNVIHDYSLTWENFNYLILKHGKFSINKKEIEVFRVIDHEKDGLYYIDSNELKEFEAIDLENNSIPAVINHNKGFVPALLISDIIDKNTGGKKSFFNKIEDLLKEYVRESSVLSIFKLLHAYPRYWQYVGKCTKCSGSGKTVDPKDEAQTVTCSSCDGKKFNLNLDVSDGIMLPMPKNDNPVIAPNVAGFSVPPIDAWGKMEDSLDKLEKKMEFAIIGTHLEEEKSNTATGRFIDTQPLDNALHKFSESEEVKKNKIADFMALWMFGEDYGKIVIKNGKRFICEHPDTILEKYLKAKKEGAPATTLNYLYKQYLLSEYQNDSLTYDIKFKEFSIEPFVHYTVKELNDLSSLNMSIQIQEKLYFTEWINDETTDFSKEVTVLKEEFKQFINTKKLKDESTKKD